MAKEAGNQMLIFGKSYHAVAQITWRQHVKAPAQSAAGTAIICDGDNRSQIGYDTRRVLAVGRRLVR
jgi:hypothetical protein